MVIVFMVFVLAEVDCLVDLDGVEADDVWKEQRGTKELAYIYMCICFRCAESYHLHFTFTSQVQ